MKACGRMEEELDTFLTSAQDGGPCNLEETSVRSRTADCLGPRVVLYALEEKILPAPFGNRTLIPKLTIL
jgi:hypothetical protein